MDGGFNLNGVSIAEKTRNSTESLADKILKRMQNPIQKTVNKKVLISGENGTAKSSLSLELFASILNDDECIIYVDIDNSGLEIITKFYEDKLLNHNIIPLIPYTTKKVEDVNVLDPQGTVYEISNIAETIRRIIDDNTEEYKDFKLDKKIIGVVVDGMSFALSYCEGSMRDEKGLDASSGVSQQFWKDRADKFREITSAYMALPLPVIFISHEDFIPEAVEQGKTFPSVKKQFINEISTRIILDKQESLKNNQVINYIASIKKNRSDLNYENRDFIFMTRKIEKEDQDDIQVHTEELLKIMFPNKVRSNKEK